MAVTASTNRFSILTKSEPKPVSNLPRRVFIGHVEYEHEWAGIVTNAKDFGKVKSSSKLYQSKIQGYYFGFITMSTHTEAQNLINHIGTDKIDVDVDFGFDYAYLTHDRQVYASWAKNKVK